MLVSRGGGLGFSDVSSPVVILIHLHQSVSHLDCNFTHLELYQAIAYSLILQHLCPALNVHVLILQPHLLLLHPPHLMVSTPSPVYFHQNPISHLLKHLIYLNMILLSNEPVHSVHQIRSSWKSTHPSFSSAYQSLLPILIQSEQSTQPGQLYFPPPEEPEDYPLSLSDWAGERSTNA